MIAKPFNENLPSIKKCKIPLLFTSPNYYNAIQELLFFLWNASFTIYE